MKSLEYNEEDDTIAIMLSPVGKKAAKIDHTTGDNASLEVYIWIHMHVPAT